MFVIISRYYRFIDAYVTNIQLAYSYRMYTPGELVALVSARLSHEEGDIGDRNADQIRRAQTLTCRSTVT
jgi:hypothetical protein